MFILKAKYNSALVMLEDQSLVENETISQIYSFLNHPAFENSHIAIMPDCHAGKGAVVGFTMKTNDYVIPNVVGVDIGCGVLAVRLDGIKNINFEALDKAVRKIPSGFHKYPIDTNGSNKPFVRNERICSKIEDLKELTRTIGTKYEDVVASLGTLGGGNHFIEVSVDEQGTYWLVIHTGSRNFGLKIANFYQNEAKKLMKQMFVGDAYKNLEFLPIDNGGKEYLYAMDIAQEYASKNRQEIAKNLIENFFKLKIKDLKKIESVHNYIDLENGYVRKGAISAQEGEELIIPLNMRDGSIIGKGKGSKKWNYSAPHGAGRILSRKKAKETLEMVEYKESMNGIYTTCISNKTIDESPMAYKNKDLILDSIGETVDFDFILKPVYNFKASD